MNHTERFVLYGNHTWRSILTKTMAEETYRYLSSTVQKTLDVLFVFMTDQKEWALAEVATAVNLPVSSVFRCLANLEVRGLIDQNRETGKYHLGIKAFELGMYAWKNLDLQTLARPYLEELSREAGETITLGVCSEDEVLYMDRVDSSKVLRATSTPGQRRPMYCTAIGKVFLSDMPSYEVIRIAQTYGLSPRTSKTITDVDRLHADLEEIRRQGYSLDLGEFEEELCCVATPIRDATGKVVASIGVAGPLARFDDDKKQHLIQIMQSTAQTISIRLGYSGNQLPPAKESP